MNTTRVPSPEGADGASPSESPRTETARLLPVLVPVLAGGAAALGFAAASFAASHPSLAVLGGVLVLLVASGFAEAFPVPLEALPGGFMAMSSVFIVGTALLYGWQPAVLVAFVTRVTLEVVQRRPLVRLGYNGAVYSLGGAAAGGVAALLPHGESVAFLFVKAALASGAFYATNIPLVSAIVSRWAGEPFVPLLRRWIYWTIVPSAIGASVTLMLAALWQRSPFLSAALVGPLVAIALYQRSMHSALKAMRLALTDALTGLGNRRHFYERLERDLDRAEREGFPLTLCLLDLDDFKGINDGYGHPAGDDVLVGVAGCLRQGGEGFRLGGDEFGVLLPGRDEREGRLVAEAIVERIGAIEHQGGRVSVSAGVATYPGDGVDRSNLLRVADAALYDAKNAGKNCVRGRGGETALAVA